MKDEPWRGNPALRVQHLEEKLSNKKARIRELEAQLDEQREVIVDGCPLEAWDANGQKYTIDGIGWDLGAFMVYGTPEGSQHGSTSLRIENLYPTREAALAASEGK